MAQQEAMDIDTLAAREYLLSGEEALADGAYQQALAATEKAQALYAQHGLWEEVVYCATELAAYADNFDDPALKINYADSALTIALRHLPPNHGLLASSYRQKAEALMLIEALDSANYFLQLAVPIFRENEDWVNVGWSEILLSVNYLNQSELEACDQQCLKVEELFRQSLIPADVKPDMQSTLLYVAGIVYELQGDVDRSIKNTQEALAIDLAKPQWSGLDSSFISAHYNNLGTSYILKGNYQQALDHFIQALDSYQEAQFDADLLNNIGGLLYRQKRYQEAMDYFHRSLETSGSNRNKWKARINSLIGLSITYRELDYDEEAIYFCQRVIDAPSNYRKFKAWAIWGNIFIKKKQASQALEYLDRAAAAYAKDSVAHTLEPFYLTKLYFIKGNAYLLKKDPTTALSFYQKALVVNHSNFVDSLNVASNPGLTGVWDPVYFLETLHAKAKALALLPDQKELALRTFQLTIEWVDSLQATYATEAAQLDWSGVFKPIYEEAIEVAYHLYKVQGDQKYLDLAFTFSEKSKNAILLETLSAKEGQLLAGVPDSLLQREKTLNQDIAFYGKTLQKARSEKEVGKEKIYQQYLSKARLELVELREKLAADYPKYQQWKNEGRATSISKVQADLLTEQTAMLEYFVGDSSAFVFVIAKHSAILLPLTAPRKLQQIGTEFHQLLSTPSAFQRNAKTAFSDYTQTAFDLYQHILQKPLDHLPPAIQRLIIVPDGVLNAIPFEALCTSATAKSRIDFSQLSYLLYDYQLQYAYSANLLLKNHHRREQLPANTTCLALAPSYQTATHTTVERSSKQLSRRASRLHGTAVEVQQISHFVDGQFNIGEQATEQSFKTQASQFGLLHLAMHGVLDLDNANFNHLLFSDLGRDRTNDNLLHHYEIANMDLSAQLVVLSACETGLGKYEKGEGVYSLARSFMYAGVPSVVMSLWKVNDESTSQLMPYFYENLMSGQSKGAALQAAKQRFLKTANVEYRHPFYWSAFVVMGDAQQLKQEGASLFWWGMGILLLLLMGGVWKRRRRP